MSLAQRVRRSPSTTAQSVGGDCLVLDLGTGAYYALGEIGGFIWQKLDSPRRLETIVPEIVGRFEIDAETAAKDLVEFVEQLLDSRLTEFV